MCLCNPFSLDEIESHAIDLVAVNVGWMRANYDGVDGFDFLNKIKQSSNMEYYNTKTLRSIIQHLY